MHVQVAAVESHAACRVSWSQEPDVTRYIFAWVLIALGLAAVASGLMMG